MCVLGLHEGVYVCVCVGCCQWSIAGSFTTTGMPLAVNALSRASSARMVGNARYTVESIGPERGQLHDCV